MGQIEVQGLGVVKIEGDAPNAEEIRAIEEYLQAQGPEPVPQGPAAPAPAPMAAPAPKKNFRERMLEKPYEPDFNPGDIIPGAISALGAAADKQSTVEGVSKELMGIPLTRDAFTMAGASAGEVLGGVGGAGAGFASPVPGGAVLGALAGKEGGAVLGAGAGSLVYDSLDALLKAYRGEEADGDMLGPAKQAVKEMAYEASGQSAVKALTPAFGLLKSGFRKLAGVASPASKQLTKLSEAYQVPLGIVQTTTRPFIKGTTRVLGVIPFVGGPFKRSADAADKGVKAVYDDILDSFAPTATLAQMGTKFTAQAQKRYQNFSNTSGILYDKFFRLVDNLPPDRQAIIPTTKLREAANLIIKQIDEGLVTKTSGSKEARIITNKIEAFARELADYPGSITPKQFRAKTKDLRELMSVAGKEGQNIQQGAAIKAAMEQDLNNPILNMAGPDGPAIKKALEKANWFYHEGAKKFESTIAGRFGRVDKHIFETSFTKAGSKHSDEIFADVFNAKSSEGLQELYKLVGPKHFNQGARTFIENALSKSYAKVKGKAGKYGLIDEAEQIDLNKFAKNMGLDTKQGRDILETMLSKSDVNIKDWDNFMTLATASKSFTLPSTSVFLQRRVTLGGLGAALTAAKVGQRSVLGALGALYVMRKGADLLTDPKLLRSLIRGMDEGAGTTARRNLIIRLGRELAIDDEGSDLPDLTESDVEQEIQSSLPPVPAVVHKLQAHITSGSPALQASIRAALSK